MLIKAKTAYYLKHRKYCREWKWIWRAMMLNSINSICKKNMFPIDHSLHNFIFNNGLVPAKIYDHTYRYSSNYNCFCPYFSSVVTLPIRSPQNREEPAQNRLKSMWTGRSKENQKKTERTEINARGKQRRALFADRTSTEPRCARAPPGGPLEIIYTRLIPLFLL
jgi:hypothetical protein